jgi:ribonuclease-3
MSFLNISLLEDAIGHRFQHRAFLEQALTHSSYAREIESQNTTGGAIAEEFDNEQMEFLGDAVLAFIVSQELFRRFPQYTEGELSKLRAHIVSARHLLHPARKLDIGQYLRLGKGEDRSGGRAKSALLVNALEAIIAALFLDAGLAAAQRFVLETIFEPELADLQRRAGEKFPVTDYKSALQEMVHALGRPQPRYVLVKEEGPEHRKLFTMETHIAASPNGEPEFVSRAWEYLQSLQNAPLEDNGAPAGESPEHP